MPRPTFGIYSRSSNLLELRYLRAVTPTGDESYTETYVNDGVVTATIVDVDGTNAAGEAWPVTLTYLAASKGRYTKQLSKNLVLDRRRKYRLTGTALTADGVTQLGFEADLYVID